jgi:sugar porter (SP) family MFS transporter
VKKTYKPTGTLMRAGIVSALGGLLFGFDTAVIAGTTAALRDIYNLSDWSLGFTVSSALIGTIAGSIVFSKPADIWGRRDTLKILAVLYLISALGSGLAWNMWSLVVFRFIGGLGIGGSSVIGPMYAAEISPARIRGRMVILFQFNVVVGILVAFFSNALIGLTSLDPLYLQWRLMFGVACLPAMLFLIMLFTIPRSPRWLAAKGRFGEAEKVLEVVGEENIPQEMEDIKRSLHLTDGGLKEKLFQKKYAYPIFLAIAVAALGQLSFINGFLYYLNDTLNAIGATFWGKFQPVMVGIFNVVACIIAFFLIDKLGRKTLLLIGSWGTAIPLALCAYIAWTHNLAELFPWSLSIYILFFSFSQGAVVWVYISEVFPNRVRAQGQALGSFTVWTSNTLAIQLYPVIVGISKNGLAIPFIFGSIIMIIQFFVVLFFFIETKGVPLEEMEKKLGMKE